ncbi:hypothetical protein HDU76_010507 [Blyttiomyces sp. JEL0837]|nr:hypothetical protein HDU76_010507 [Blyttiomyces sp. JEL0837]
MKRSKSPQTSEDDTPSATSLTTSDDDSDVLTDSDQSQEDYEYDYVEESNDDSENSKSRNSSTDPSTHLSYTLSALSQVGHKTERRQANSSENSTIEDYDADDEDVNENPHGQTPPDHGQTQDPYIPPTPPSEPIDQGTQTGEGITQPPLPINRHYKNYKPYRQTIKRLSRRACQQNSWPAKYTPHLARELFKALCAKSFPVDDKTCVLPYRLEAVWGLFVQDTRSYAKFCDEILGGRFLHYIDGGEGLLPLKKKKDMDEQAAVVEKFNTLLRTRRYCVMLFSKPFCGQVETDWPEINDEAELWCWDVNYPKNHMPPMQPISTCGIDENGNKRNEKAGFFIMVGTQCNSF